MQVSEMTKAPQPSGSGSFPPSIWRDSRPLTSAEILGFWSEVVENVSASLAWMYARDG